MESLIELDKNMAVEKTIGETDVVWYDVRRAPFALHGLYCACGEPVFHRLPDDVAQAASEPVSRLQYESAGGRVRFSTDSPYIALRAVYRNVGRSSHLTLVSTAGFDLYQDGEFGPRYVQEFRMPYDMEDRYEQLIRLQEGGMLYYTVNFPVHSVVESLEIGLMPGAKLGGEKPYRDIAPLLFYGSSIVHGTAASRPGLTYENRICRALNMDYLNIGFSGHAKGELPLVRYLAQVPHSVFICDYDHNAPDVQFLSDTHLPMYRAYRELNPDTPYIMITRPDYYTMRDGQETVLQRRDVILRSYLAARDEGDKNVYFIDGTAFFAGDHVYDCTMDHVHPNDYGFLRMGETIGCVIRHILEKQAERP